MAGGHSIVMQSSEEYTSLTLIYEGEARQLQPEFVGDIRLNFPSAGGVSIFFEYISSVLCCDEMLWTRESFPYFKDCNGLSGLFMVSGSSYLSRIEPYFPDHKHYIYFDRDFNWHITA